MLDVEVFGAGLAPGAPTEQEIRRLCSLSASRMGIEHAHVAIEFVDAERVAQLNAAHRDKPAPTDVLSFPIDGVEDMAGSPRTGDAAAPSDGQPPRELGDIVICPEHTTDNGEMLALQDALLAEAGR